MPEIKIEDWTNTGECDFKYVAKGHHDDAAFTAAVRAYETEIGAEPLDDLTVHRRWFVIDGQSGLAKQVPEGTPDAVPYTETNWF